jgi:hypothetical protein
VDNTGTGEVNHTLSTEEVFFSSEGAQESISSPDRVDNDRVHECGKEDGVAQVGRHLATFSDGTGHNSGSSSSESKLEEKGNVRITVSLDIDISKEEASVSDETEILVVAIRVTVRKCVSDRPETKSSTASIEQVFQHDILHILLANGTSAKHGETRLHEEHSGTL